MIIERVLIIEDEQQEAEQLSKAFRKLIGQPEPGVDPAPWVSNVPEALRRLLQEKFSVVVLDLTLRTSGPLDEGVRVLRFLRAVCLFQPGLAPPPVVVVTGREIIPICVRAMQAGASDYILKGYSGDGRISEDTIGRVYGACEEAVARATGIEKKAFEDWLRLFTVELQRHFGGKFLTVFSPGAQIEGAVELGGRRFLAFESKDEAVATFLVHPDWLDAEIHLAFIGKEQTDAAGL